MITQKFWSLLNWNFGIWRGIEQEAMIKRLLQGQGSRKITENIQRHGNTVSWHLSFAGVPFLNLGWLSVAESLKVVERYTPPPLPYEIIKQSQWFLP